MTFGLSENHIEKIRHVLIRYPAVQRGILYGSRAKGNFKAGSDIDLTLEGKNLTHNDLNRIRTDLDDLNLPYIIDLSLKDEVENKDLQDHIHRVGINFYTSKISSIDE